MTKFTENIIAGLIILFLLAYVGYQVFRVTYNPVDVETVYEYSVAKSVEATGIAVREETSLDQPTSGVESYLFEDATRVSVGETVAEFYNSKSGDRNIKRTRELEKEILFLREAQESGVNNYGNTEIYNRDIKDQVGRLSAMSSTGRYQNVADLRQNLTILINKKQISTGKAENFDPRIQQLETELQGLKQAATAETITTVTAPVSGYFSRTVDGYEGMMTPNALDDYTVEDFEKVLARQPTMLGNRAGKMVLSQNWYFAMIAQKDDIDWVKAGQTVLLQFDQIVSSVPATVYRVVDEKENDTSVLVFRCNQMSEELINLRVSKVVVQFQQYSGLRINTAYLRFRVNKDGESERGVYILKNNTAYFRLLDPIYEEDSFVLSRTYFSSVEYVEAQKREMLEQAATEGSGIADSPIPLSPEPQDGEDEGADVGDNKDKDENTEEEVADIYKRYVILFDQIITQGNDLYDGKVIQDS